MEASNNKHNEDKPQFLNEYEPERKGSDRIVRFADPMNTFLLSVAYLLLTHLILISLSLYPWRKGSGFGR